MKTIHVEKCVLQDLKLNPISAKEIDHLASLAGSYEALFSRRAIKYRTLKLKDKKLTEKDIRKLMLEEYTFIKRPLIVVNDKIFIGTFAKEIQKAKSELEK